MKKNLSNHRQFESDNKMESDPSQSNSSLISTSPITKNVPMEEKVGILQHDDKSTNAKILKQIDIMKKRLDTIIVETDDIFEAEKTQLQTTVAEKQEIISQYSQDAEKHKIEIAQLKESNEKLQAEKLQLNNVNASLQKSVETTEKEKAECESKISELKESNEKLQTENCGLKEADKTYKEKLASKEETIHALQNENAKLKESNEKLQAENLGLKNVTASLQKSTETSEKEKAECESKISQLTETCNAKEAEIYSLKNEIGSLQTTLNNSVASNSKLRKGKSKLQKELSQMNDTKKELNNNQMEKIQKLDTEICQLKNQNAALTEENGFLKAVAPSICYNKDVVVNGKIDYQKLKNVFVVDKLEQKVDGKWYADDDYEYSFKNSNSNIFVKEELYICSDLNTVVNRAHFYNLKHLHIHNSTITLSDFKSMVSSCNYIHCLQLDFITVKNKNCAVIGIDQLIKDVLQNKPNIEKFIYGFISGKNVSEIAQKLSQLPVFHHIFSIKKFVLHNIQEGFDLKAFSEFIKKYPRSEYELEFYGSDKYYTQIKDIEKELRPTLPETCKLDVCRRYSF